MISRYYVGPPKKHRPVVHDPQRHLVYRMERDIIGWAINTTTDIDSLQDIADHACREHGVSEVEINTINKPDYPVFGYADHAIYLNAGYNGQNVGTLLHELAHWIVFEQNPKVTEHHGKEFIRVYGDLLDRYKMMPKHLFYKLCDQYKVEY